MNFGALHFAAPLALAAFALLPLLWWAIRATPPPPRRQQFPPARLLQGLATDEQSRERPPLWLLLLRALALALMILGFARPSLAPALGDGAGGGRTLVVLDDGWTAAPAWNQMRAAAINAAADAERANAPVHILTTAPQIPPSSPGEALIASDARGRLARLEPKPWRPDRAEAAERLARDLPGDLRFDRIVWISDGLSGEGDAALAEALKARGPVTLANPPATALGLVAASVTQRGVEASVRRAETGPARTAIAAETIEGRALGAAEITFAASETTAIGRIELPPEIAARTTRVRIVGETSAGAVRLLAGGAQRPFVGLIDPGGAGQAMLSEIYFVERALAPYASLQRDSVAALIEAGAQAMILPDSGRIAPADRARLARWIEQGGLLVRFAGPRLANDSDDLLPVRLRPGSRAIGGALAWEEPLGVAAFTDDSPFAGLSIPADVAVRQQVLAEPAALEQTRIWARLEDGSPLVTAAPRRDGLVVLFHIAAGPTWSDLPLSGLFVDMLRRTLAFSARADGAGARAIEGGPFVAQRLLDGFGASRAAPADSTAIPSERFATARASPATPPGLYERAGLAAALDAAGPEEPLSALQTPNGVARASLGAGARRPLAGWLLGAALAILAADALIALMLSGRLPRWPRLRFPFQAAALLALAMVAASWTPADAQSLYRTPPGGYQAPPVRARTSDPTLALRLAYVRTGDARIDRTAQAGLEALSNVLGGRTSVEPGAPIAVDLARDDLSPYPFLYWPAPSAPQRLSDEALANLDHYLAIGGLLFVDTRDAGARVQTRPAATMLAGLDAPPLTPVTNEHVVARAFYLLRSFPGRASAPQLWAESADAAQARDGVASLFVGDGDWAAAWAGTATLSGGPRQRELALRFGVNMVMVSLTGNYKADQVHVPALLERLGRD